MDGLVVGGLFSFEAGVFGGKHVETGLEGFGEVVGGGEAGLIGYLRHVEGAFFEEDGGLVEFDGADVFDRCLAGEVEHLTIE